VECFVKLKFLAAGGGAVAATAAVAVALGLGGASADSSVADSATSTPIKHVVVIFDENESFDHYFGTYPNAQNLAGENAFTAKPGTPSVNGLTPTLLTANPNSHQPIRLTPAQAVTCSQGHAYGAEQKAFDGGLMDKFPENTAGTGAQCNGQSMVMDYYDGNTVTGLWNLAQNFALNDNSYSTNFGPSTVGAINLISGQTHGTTSTASGVEQGTIIGDPDPSTADDDCGSGATVMTGKNVGDLLNAKGVSWGWFEGGFAPTTTVAGKAVCGSTHANISGTQQYSDYSPHHEPFEYYASTANQHHTAPASVAEIGHSGPANHQYDLTAFDQVLSSNRLPAVSYLKPAQFEDAHPGNSDPIDEQRFIARYIDALEDSPEWSSTAVIIAYDDSDGWYDHQQSPLISPSAAPSDALDGTGKCGTVSDPTAYPDRCGFGPRQPLLVISPYARQNDVDHTLTDQSSVLKFIEDNWSLGRIGDQSADAAAGSLMSMFDFNAGPVAPKIYLDPTTGEVTKTVAMPPVTAPSSGGGTVVVTQTTTTPAVTVTTPAPASSPSSTPTPTTTTTTQDTPKAPKLACTAKSAGKKISVSCKATGGSGARTAVRFRVIGGGKQLATAATTVRSGRATATLKAKEALKHGAYKLTVTIATAGLRPTSTTKSVKLG
jgi:phospholipase C